MTLVASYSTVYSISSTTQKLSLTLRSETAAERFDHMLNKAKLDQKGQISVPRTAFYVFFSSHKMGA